MSIPLSPISSSLSYTLHLKHTDSYLPELHLSTLTTSHVTNDFLLIGLSNGEIYLYKYKHDREPYVKVAGHIGKIHCLYYSGELNLVMSGSADRTIKLWDIHNREKKCIQTLIGHGGTVTALTYTRNCIISCSSDSKVYIWRTDKERSLLYYPWYVVSQVISDFHNSMILSLTAHDSESGSIYIGDSRGVLSIYSPVLKQKNNIEEYVITRPQQQLHVLASFDNNVKVIDASTGYIFLTIDNPNHCRYTCIQWENIYHELYLVDELGFLHIWNVNSEKCLKMIRIREDCISTISLLSGDRIMFTSATCSEIWKITREKNIQDYKGHYGPILQFGFNKENHLLSASLDNTIRTWEIYDMSCNNVHKYDISEISCLCSMTDSNFAFTGHEDGSLAMWSTDADDISVVKYHSNTISSLAYYSSVNKDILVSVGYDSQIVIWNITKRKTNKPLVERVIEVSPYCEIFCVQVNEIDNSFFIGCSDSTIKCYDENSEFEKYSLKGHTDAVTCIAQDGFMIISGSDDKTLRVWDLVSKRQVQLLEKHTASIRDLKVGPSGLIISCSLDEIYVWDYVKGCVIQSIENTDESFRCIILNDKLVRSAILRNEDSSNSQSAIKIIAGTENCSIMLFLLDQNLYDYEFNPREYCPEDYGIDLTNVPSLDFLVKTISQQVPFVNASAPRPITALKVQTPVAAKAAVIIPVQKVNLIKNITSVRPLAPSNLNVVKRPVAAGVMIHPLVKQALQTEEVNHELITSPEKRVLPEWKPLPSKSKTQSSLFSPLAPPQ